MTEEEIKAAQEAEAKAKATDDETAEDESEEEESEEEDKSKDKDADTIDYEAELAKEREAREKAEKAAADNAFKLREARRKKDDDTEEEEEDKPLTSKELQSILAKERQETTKSLETQRIGEIASKIATSDSEKALIIEIHKNRTFPPHLSLEEQIEESFVIANRKKLIGERNEALRALKSKSGVNNNPAGTHQDAPKAGEPKMSPADATAIKAVGYSWNGTTRQYEKKISSGTLVYDPKTKKTRIVK